ncbi:mercuric reductase [Salinisphaera sp. RV14]|uniref:mercuric reductase n=1 Tax=unclassified Salinisphaera TaxID=2649847 RepID=UPI003F842122
MKSVGPALDYPCASTSDQELCAHARPADWRNPRPRLPYDWLVIGAGPAGLTAARSAAALGARVALVESHLLGGVSLNYGSVSAQALIRTSRLYAEMRDAAHYGARAPAHVDVDFPLAMERMRRIRARLGHLNSAASVAALGIDLFFGAARFVSDDAIDLDGTRLTFKKALIATGSRSLLPTLPGLTEAGYLTNETVFDLTELPASLLVIGGGPVGCELAQAFCRFGSHTIIVHDEPLFLPREERDAAQLLSAALAQDGVEIHLNTTAINVRMDNGRKVIETVNDGDVTTLTADTVLTGIGRVPAVAGLDLEAAGVVFDTTAGIRVDDFLRTSNRRIFAAGDVCMQHQFVDTAHASAQIAVHNALCRQRRRVSALTTPWCTYTDPEIAHVGLYVREARERGIPIKTFTVPMHEVDRAIVDGGEEGFVKIHVREGTDTILGATIVARHAGEMINDLSLAIVAGIGLDTMAGVIHAYPTQAEAIRKAAQACRRTPRPRWPTWLQRGWLRR